MSEMLRTGVLVPVVVMVTMVMLVIAFLLISSSGIPNAGGSSGMVSAANNLNAAMGAMGVFIVTGISIMAMGRRR